MAKEVIIEKTYEMMEGFGASDSMVDEAILRDRKTRHLFCWEFS